MKQTKVYANFNAEIYEIMYADGSYTGWTATNYEDLCELCRLKRLKLERIDGFDDED